MCSEYRKKGKNTIDPKQYPMLWRIMWDRPTMQRITLEDAFSLYQYRWEYIFPEEMTEKERLFLESLIRDIGQGQFRV